MSEWKQRRFWKAASVARDAEGHGVHLDGRPIRTPARAPLRLPAAALAQAIAAEWDAQDDEIDPTRMPLTRIANSAIDTVAVQRAEVVDVIAAYGDSDLLCYRADGPSGLVERQAHGWDPLLDWAQRTLEAPMTVATGVMHVRQPEASLAALRGRVEALDPFDLAPLHELVALSGSLVIGLAALHRHRPVPELWALSRIDETWQAEQWGDDEDARQAAAVKAAAFADAARFHALRREG